jgi:uncharacterized protein YbjQ (UPF0145 family)
MYKILIIALVFGLGLMSCSISGSIRTSDASKAYEETSAAKIEVYSLKDIGRDYIVIGEVSASSDAGEDAEGPVELIKEEAAGLGADAIVNLELRFSNGFWSTGILAVGTAVKFK